MRIWALTVMAVMTTAAVWSAGGWVSIDAAAGLGHDTVTALAVHRFEVYIGTPRGLYRSAGGMKVAREARIPETYISAVAAIGGDVWVGTPDGLYIFTPSGRQPLIFLTRKEGLLSSEITAIAYDESYVYIGTKWGINLIDRNTRQLVSKKYTVINGLPSNKVYKITASPAYIAVATERGFAWKKKFEAMFITPDKEAKVKELQVNAVSLAETTLYAATHGDGIYQFNMETYAFVKHDASQGKLSDNFVNDIAIDGTLLYAGTFEGGAWCDRETDTWTIISDAKDTLMKAKLQSPIGNVEVGGERVFLGTEGNGLLLGYRRPPEVTIEPSLIYAPVTNEGKTSMALSVHATMMGMKGGIKDFRLSCRDGLSGKEITKGITLSPVPLLEGTQRKGFFQEQIARINFAENQLAPRLWDFIVTVEAEDMDGNKNKSSQVFLYDSEVPQIKFLTFKEYTAESTMRIEGKYKDYSLKSVTIEPDVAPVDVKELFSTFSVAVPLNEGENIFTLTLADICGNTMTNRVRIVRDIKPPEVLLDSPEVAVPWDSGTLVIPFKDDALDETQVYILKGDKRILCEVDKAAKTISARLSAGEIPVKHMLVMYDLVGQKTEYPFMLFRSAEMVDIILESPDFISDVSAYALRGKIFSRTDVSISAKDTDNNITPGVYDRSSKQFSIPLVLKPGTNAMKLIASNTAGFSREKKVQIFCTAAAAARTKPVIVSTGPVNTVPDAEVERMKQEMEALRKKNEELEKAAAKTNVAAAVVVVPREREKVVYRNVEGAMPEQSPALVLVSVNFNRENALQNLVTGYYGNASIIEWVLAVNALIPNESLKNHGKIVLPNKKMIEFLIIEKRNDDIIRRIRADAQGLFNRGEQMKIYSPSSLSGR